MSNPREVRNLPFNETIAKLVRYNKVFAVYNTLAKNRVIEAYQTIIASNRIKLVEYQLYSNDYRFNIPRMVEVTVLLDLVKRITLKACKISIGRITTVIDNKKMQ